MGTQSENSALQLTPLPFSHSGLFGVEGAGAELISKRLKGKQMVL